MIGWQIAAFAVPASAALGLGSWITHRLLRYRSPNTTQETLGEVSIEISLDRYRPMARLLDPEDLRFLASQPGYRDEMGARLKNSRRRIFRMYLGELSAEFQRLHATARGIAAVAPEGYAHLIPALMRQQFAFWRALAAIELRLTLGWAGITPADASGLVDLVAQLQRTLANAVPETA